MNDEMSSTPEGPSPRARTLATGDPDFSEHPAFSCFAAAGVGGSGGGRSASVQSKITKEQESFLGENKGKGGKSMSTIQAEMHDFNGETKRKGGKTMTTVQAEMPNDTFEGEAEKNGREITKTVKTDRIDDAFGGWKPAIKRRRHDAEPPHTCREELRNKRESEGSSLLHNHSQGISATLQHLRWKNYLTPDENLKNTPDGRITNLKISTPRHRTIQDLPLEALEEIIIKLGNDGLSRAMASSSFFLRVAMAPCNCNAFQPTSRFLGALISTKAGSGQLAVPSRASPRVFDFASNFLTKFLQIALKSRAWARVADTRGGHLLLIDTNASRFEILRPFHSIKGSSLPPQIPMSSEDQLLTAVVIPEKTALVVVILVRVSATQITMKKFASPSGKWEQKQLKSPYVLSEDMNMRLHAVYVSDTIHILDVGQKRILTFTAANDHLDSIRLPGATQLGPLPCQHQVLAITTEGQLCLAVLQHSMVNIFVQDGTTWARRWRWNMPAHFYSCHLLGHSQNTGQLILRCYDEASCLDIAQGTLRDLRNSMSTKDCLCFELEHSIADHA